MKANSLIRFGYTVFVVRWSSQVEQGDITMTLQPFFHSFLLAVYLLLGSSQVASAVSFNHTSPVYSLKRTNHLKIFDGTYGSRSLSYWVTSDNLAVIDGDVIYGPVSILLAHSNPNSRPTARAHSVRAGTNTWPGGVVTYNFDSAATETALSTIVNGAITNWKAVSPFLTFKKVANSATGTNGVLTIKNPSCGGCNSVIGFSSGAMTMNLQQDCPASPGTCGVAEATHEFGHALGLYHEHQRFDREKFVHYNCQNLNPACPAGVSMPAGVTCCSTTGIPAGCCGSAGNFNILTGPAFDAAGTYDVNSIMQYRANGFALPGTNTLTPAAPGIVVPASNPSTISPVDADRICKLYAGVCPKANSCAAEGCPVEKCITFPLCPNPRLPVCNPRPIPRPLPKPLPQPRPLPKPLPRPLPRPSPRPLPSILPATDDEVEERALPPIQRPQTCFERKLRCSQLGCDFLIN